MKLFEYAIIHNPRPTKADKDEGRTPPSVLVKPITSVLAEDDKQVAILAAREIPADLLPKLAEVEIAIRPF